MVKQTAQYYFFEISNKLRKKPYTFIKILNPQKTKIHEKTNPPPKGYVFTFLMCLTMFVSIALQAQTSNTSTNSNNQGYAISVSSDLSSVSSEHNPGITMTAVPNPFNDYIAVLFKSVSKSQNQNKAYRLNVLDATGKIIATQLKLNISTNLKLNTANYAAGFYLITLNDDRGVVKSTTVVKINR